MSDTRIIATWENERKTIMRIHYPAGYTVQDYRNMLINALEMIEGNTATIIYINYYPEGSRMPDGDIITAASHMMKTFTVDAMIQWHETRVHEVFGKAIAKSFGFETGKNVWFVRDEDSALTLAHDLDARLNSSDTAETED